MHEYFLCNSLVIRAFVTSDISKVLCYTFKTGQSHVTRHGKAKQDEASKQCVVLLTSNIRHEYGSVFNSSEITYRDQINKPMIRKKKLQVILPIYSPRKLQSTSLSALQQNQVHALTLCLELTGSACREDYN